MTVSVKLPHSEKHGYARLAKHFESLDYATVPNHRGSDGYLNPFYPLRVDARSGGSDFVQGLLER